MASAEKKRRTDTSGKRLFDDNWEHEFFLLSVICYLPRERRCDEEVQCTKTLRLEFFFYSAYAGKGEPLKEFKKSFDVYVGEAKRVSVFAQGATRLNEAGHRVCHSLAQYQIPFAQAEMFKKAFLAGAEVMFAGFPNKEKIVKKISKLPLSADTCARRCEDLDMIHRGESRFA